MKKHFQSKIFRHYKNKQYRYIDEVIHSETLEKLIHYECLYPNKISQFWVRPKDLFFGETIIDGQPTPRFQAIDYIIESIHDPTNDQIDKINNLLNEIFDSFDRSKIEEKLKNKSSVLLLNAYLDGQLIGFKLGYQVNTEVFYSWLGGIHPDYRRFGIGLNLLKTQHQWAKEQSFKRIETKTMNKWRSMLLMNIRSGFEVTGTEVGSRGDLKILMTKKL